MSVPWALEFGGLLGKEDRQCSARPAGQRGRGGAATARPASASPPPVAGGRQWPAAREKEAARAPQRHPPFAVACLRASQRTAEHERRRGAHEAEERGRVAAGAQAAVRRGAPRGGRSNLPRSPAPHQNPPPPAMQPAEVAIARGKLGLSGEGADGSWWHHTQPSATTAPHRGPLVPRPCTLHRSPPTRSSELQNTRLCVNRCGVAFPRLLEGTDGKKEWRGRRRAGFRWRSGARCWFSPPSSGKGPPTSSKLRV